MALNWNAFLNDEGLNLPNERWPSSTAGQSINTQPTTTSSSQRQSLSLAADPADFSTFEQPNRQDTFFSDAYYGPGDYFLSDLEVLEPLGTQIAEGGSTSESSPEPSSNIALGTHGSHTVFQQPKQGYSSSQTPATTRSSLSPSTSNNPGSAITSSQALPNNTQYSSLFPDQTQPRFIEDLTFSNGPSGASQIPTTTSAALDNLATEITLPKAANMKRPKNKPDVLSACWTSPLCPNHGKDGPPPNPSTCGGGCAPFLFSAEDPLATATIDGQLLNNDVSEQNSPEGVVEIRPKLKRSESEASSRGPSGRTFSTTSTADIRPRVKSESSGDSPEQVQSEQPDEPKGKARRRLPHNQVERKYRESLNTQLDSLRRVVPALQQQPRAGDGVDIEDLPTPSKPSKAVVLASATAYIKQMEKDKKQLADENQLLRTRIKALQALVKCEDCSLMQYVMDLKIHNQT